MNTLQRINNDKLVFKALVSKLAESHKYKNPSYQVLVNYLNSNNLKTSWGNSWTRKSLFRYLQRNGFSGVWGLRNDLKQYNKLAKFL